MHPLNPSLYQISIEMAVYNLLCHDVECSHLFLDKWVDSIVLEGGNKLDIGRDLRIYGLKESSHY